MVAAFRWFVCRDVCGYEKGKREREISRVDQLKLIDAFNVKRIPILFVSLSWCTILLYA
jgi:hypothetical protein